MRTHTPLAVRTLIPILGALRLHRGALELSRRRGPVSGLSVRVIRSIGDSHLACGDTREALRWFAEGLCIDPANPGLLRRLRSAIGRLSREATETEGELRPAAEAMAEGFARLGSGDGAAAAQAFLRAERIRALAPLARALAERARERDRLSGRFCGKPFTDMHINRGGKATPCCAGWLPVKLGSVLDRSKEAIWNSATLQAVRESIHDGSFRFCDRGRCPHLVAGDLPRRDEVEDPRLLRIMEQRSVVLDRGPRRVVLGFDRSCNLSCPSCRDELLVLKGEELAEAERILAVIERSWLDDAELLKTSNAGDPFGSPMMKRMLQALDPVDRPNLSLQLITNGQAFTPANWEKIEKIRGRIVELEVSVDAATAGTYSVVRRGGDFARLMANLEFIRSLRREGFIPRWTLSFVVQNRNYREMPGFVRLGRSLEVDQVIFKKITVRGPLGASPGVFVSDFQVHDERNPEHARYVECLGDPILRDPIVRWHSLPDEFADSPPSPPGRFELVSPVEAPPAA